MRIATKREGEKVETLDRGPVQEVKLGPVTVAGATPGAAEFEQPNAREQVSIVDTAPIVGDATGDARDLSGYEFKKERKFRVMNTGGKYVNDPNGGGRVHLHEGKEISTKHYPVRELQRQGLRLQEVKDDDEPVDEPVAGQL